MKNELTGMIATLCLPNYEMTVVTLYQCNLTITERSKVTLARYKIRSHPKERSYRGYLDNVKRP